MSIRRDKFPTGINPETGLITDCTEVEWSAEAAEQRRGQAVFITRSTRGGTRPQLKQTTLGPNEYGICTHLESALPDPREEQ